MMEVLIADDEPSVISSLKEGIAWEELGLHLAACVSNGREALETISKTQIHIAILDIRMPGISGLELCEILRRKQDNIQIIIISGYAEFSYAERAINYEVLGYCLKPLEYEKVTGLLRKAVKNLTKAYPRAVSGDDLMDAVENGETEKAAAVLERMGLSGGEFYVAVTIGEGRLSFTNRDGICIQLGRNQNGYLFRRPLLHTEMEKYLSKPENQGLGYSQRPVAVQELSSMFDTCMVQACQFFVEPQNHTFHEVDERSAAKLLEQIAQNMEKNHWEAVCEQLAAADETCRNAFTVRSATRLCNMIHTSSLFREEETDYYIYNLKQLMADYGTFSNMVRRLREEIAAIRGTADQEEGFSNTAFMKLMLYIRENYKKEISLTSAGAAVHMSPNYISQLFKKETGVTFIHYITQLRMEDAIQLLTATQVPVVNIAMEVGFNDYFYFLKIFKKYTGKTPNQYRNES